MLERGIGVFMHVSLVLLLAACSSPSSSPTSSPLASSPSPPGSTPEEGADPCLTAEGFPGCFEDAWCEAWTACGFEEDCVQTRPWTTHYESDNGTMTLDCEDIEEPAYGDCLDLVTGASCEELYDAAQLDASNGPWIGVCITRSCV